MKRVRILLITALLIVIASGNYLSAQKIAFIVTDVIRDNFSEAKQAEQRVKSMVDDWKREIDNLDKKIEDIKSEISRNRLIWTDEEKTNKDKELTELSVQRLEYARRKFEPGGEYDQTVKLMMKPVEDKIFATVQQVAADEGYDVILDKSVQNIPYFNSKYDMTVKVLRKLGVDVDKLEKDLNEKIAKDPRNQKVEQKQAPGKRTKSRTGDKEIKRDDKPQNEENPTNPDINNKEISPANKLPADTSKPFRTF